MSFFFSFYRFQGGLKVLLRGLGFKVERLRSAEFRVPHRHL